MLAEAMRPKESGVGSQESEEFGQREIDRLANGRDPRLNEYGVYRPPYKLVRVPLAKTSRARCDVLLVERLDGTWVFGYDFAYKMHNQEADPNDDGKGFANELEAVMAATAAFLQFDRDLPAGVVSSVTAWRRDREGHGEAGNGKMPAANGRLTHGPKKAVASPAAGQELTVRIDQIAVTDNVRKEFEQTEIDSLAETLGEVGMLQRPIVREARGSKPIGPDRAYELVAGERRLRAAIKAGWTEIPVIVQELDDQGRLKVQFIENLQRKNLNPIETAELLLRATTPIDAGGLGLTQAEAGQLLPDKLSQPRVSQAIGLLGLPSWARQLVISGQITPKHAEALAPLCDGGPIERIARKLIEAWAKKNEVPPAHDVVHELNWPIKRELGPLGGRDWVEHGWVDFAVDVAALDDAVRQKLQPCQFDGDEWGGDKKLAEKLLAAAKAKAIDRREAKGKKKTAGKAGAEVKRSPAELKALKAKADRQYAKRLEEWYHDWRRVVIAKHLGDKPWGPGLLALWWMVCGHPTQYGLEWDAGDAFSRLIDKPHGDPDVDIEQLTADPKRLAKVAVELVRSLLVNADGSPEPGCVDPHFLGVLVRVLPVDLPAEWSADRKSPLRERYWDLHSKDQLVELGAELGVHLDGNAKKSVMLQILLGVERGLALPKELAALAGAKKKGRR